jgi:hypothetical protein
MIWRAAAIAFAQSTLPFDSGAPNTGEESVAEKLVHDAAGAR